MYSQGSNGDADIENRFADIDSGEKGEGETNGESTKEACTLPYVK